MITVILAAFAAAIFMGLNIGGNNAAASMGAAYGAKARTKVQAVVLIGIFAVLGALTSGEEVIKTLGKGIITSEIYLEGAVVIVAAAAICIFIANIIKVPISTSQAAVGAVVGFGIFIGSGFSQLNGNKLIEIGIWWIVTPVAAWSASYLAGKYLYPRILMWVVDNKSEASIRKMINVLLTISGCYVAFSAGANNAANAVGPFVGAGTWTVMEGALIGGLSMGVGALLLGGRVLDTVGKEITELCTIRAVFVEFISAFIVHVASIMGIPVSLGEIVTASVIGIGCAISGMHVARSDTVKKIVVAWFASPMLAGIATIAILAFI